MTGIRVSLEVSRPRCADTNPTCSNLRCTWVLRYGRGTQFRAKGRESCKCGSDAGASVSADFVD
jgi:hypothetical protein